VQCYQCGRPVSEDATACPGCQADLSYTVIGSDGKQYGPFPLTTVRRCLAEGRITPTSMVSQGGQPWVAAERVLQQMPAPPVAGRPAPFVPRGRPATDTNRTILIVVGVVVVVVLIGVAMLAAVMVSSFSKGYHGAHTASCLSNAKQLALAQLMWAQDHEETFPDAATWKQDVGPYVRNQQTFICPAGNRGEDSYEMNPELSNVKLETIPRPRDTPLLYDAGFPNGKPPHSEGWVVAFADGHAKCISASEAAAYR
jgi:hypothetical protein